VSDKVLAPCPATWLTALHLLLLRALLRSFGKLSRQLEKLSQQMQRSEPTGLAQPPTAATYSSQLARLSHLQPLLRTAGNTLLPRCTHTSFSGGRSNMLEDNSTA
jgi:hypothetical protein